VFAATAADVDAVVIDGQQVVCDGEHLTVPAVGAELAAAVSGLFA
jgi:cytosine/adenosine deaminase-related metal-dependent hydrolase